MWGSRDQVGIARGGRGYSAIYTALIAAEKRARKMYLGVPPPLTNNYFSEQ